METKIYNTKGKEAGSVKLPEGFRYTLECRLVHQVVVSMMSNARTPVAHTKTRGEVRGGGKKPWQQKGLGRARHGSIRSPIWVGGGVAHGPRNDKNFSRKINRKMKAKLLRILSKKFKDG
jgi:large subunit ribosomal protein L4